MRLIKFDLDEGPIWINPRTIVAVRPSDDHSRTIIFLMGMAGQVAVPMTPGEVLERLNREGAVAADEQPIGSDN